MRALSFFVLLIIALRPSLVGAQPVWPSPEVERVYKEGRDALSRGDARKAIPLLQQVADLAPDVPEGRRDLAQALVLSGDPERGIQELEPLFKSRTADAATYRMGAQAYLAQKKTDAARKLLRDGLRRHPDAGILYYERGNLEEAEQKREEALTSWLEGIERDPVFYQNYHKAAETYIFSKKLIWAILYAETFLLYEYQTPRATQMRSLLYSAYKRFFFPTAADERANPDGSRLTNRTPDNFEDAVTQALRRQAPVMSDGITTENLTMARARFLADWMSSYDRKYPYALFRHLDQMLRGGVFEAYNQQLLGRVEQGSGFEAWNKMNPAAMPEFARWADAHKIRPLTNAFYNDKKTRDLLYQTGQEGR